MQYVLIAVIVLLLAYMYWSGRKRAEIDESFLRFVVPLPEPVEFDPTAFTRAFREQWGGDTTCDENPDWADEKDQVRRYAVDDGVSKAVISDYAIPLPKRLTRLALMTSHALTNQERDDLEFHTAVLTIESVPDPEHAVQCVRSVARMLITLMKLYPGVGYANASAQVYYQRSRVEPFMDDDLHSPQLLLAVCTSVHLVSAGKGVWLHTHGMRYFGLPDLEVRFSDDALSDDYYDLLMNVAAHAIERETPIEAGDTVSFDGHDEVFALKRSRLRSRRHHGRWRALEVVGRPPSRP
ncbi:MAG: DUF4261 domain-containing protein [Armatimonadetes bacterium]|nr:DUF4261 domain-containing protein [Armatimonadota bacterium]